MFDRQPSEASPVGRLGLWLGTASLAVLILLLPAAGSTWPIIGLSSSMGLIGALALLLVSDRRGLGDARWFVLATLAFLVSSLLSIALARMPEASWERSLGLPMAVVTGLVAVLIGASSHAWRLISAASIVAVLVIAADLCWQRWSGTSLFTGIPNSPRQQASLPNANDVGMVVPLTMLVSASVDLARWRGRLSAIAMLSVVVWCFLASDSRNILIGAAAGGLVVVGAAAGSLRRPTRVGLAALLLAMPLLLPMASARHRAWTGEVARQAEAIEAQRSASGIDESTAAAGPPLVAALMRSAERSPRWRLAMVGWRTFLDDPWVGCGPGLFAEAWWHQEGRVAWGEVSPKAGYMPWAHNLAIEALAERGVIGFAASTMVVGVSLVMALRALRNGSLGAERRRRVVAAAAASLALLAMGFFDLTLLKDWVSLLLFASLGLLVGACSGVSAESHEPQGQQ